MFYVLGLLFFSGGKESIGDLIICIYELAQNKYGSRIHRVCINRP